MSQSELLSALESCFSSLFGFFWNFGSQERGNNQLRESLGFLIRLYLVRYR
jgi:hypothetical protein